MGTKTVDQEIWSNMIRYNRNILGNILYDEIQWETSWKYAEAWNFRNVGYLQSIHSINQHKTCDVALVAVALIITVQLFEKHTVCPKHTGHLVGGFNPKVDGWTNKSYQMMWL